MFSRRIGAMVAGEVAQREEARHADRADLGDGDAVIAHVSALLYQSFTFDAVGIAQAARRRGQAGIVGISSHHGVPRIDVFARVPFGKERLRDLPGFAGFQISAKVGENRIDAVHLSALRLGWNVRAHGCFDGCERGIHAVGLAGRCEDVPAFRRAIMSGIAHDKRERERAGLAIAGQHFQAGNHGVFRPVHLPHAADGCSALSQRVLKSAVEFLGASLAHLSCSCWGSPALSWPGKLALRIGQARGLPKVETSSRKLVAGHGLRHDPQRLVKLHVLVDAIDRACGAPLVAQEETSIKCEYVNRQFALNALFLLSGRGGCVLARLGVAQSLEAVPQPGFCEPAQSPWVYLFLRAPSGEMPARHARNKADCLKGPLPAADQFKAQGAGLWGVDRGPSSALQSSLLNYAHSALFQAINKNCQAPLGTTDSFRGRNCKSLKTLRNLARARLCVERENRPWHPSSRRHACVPFLAKRATSER